MLFNLLSGYARPLSNDLDVVVGHVGVSLDGKLAEGDDASGKEQEGEAEHEQAVIQSKINNSANHRLLPYEVGISLSISFCFPSLCFKSRLLRSCLTQVDRYWSRVFCRTRALETTWSPGLIPDVISCMLPGSMVPVTTSRRLKWLALTGA